VRSKSSPAPDLSPISLRNDFRKDPILESAYEYWRSKCGTRAMPRRRDLEAVNQCLSAMSFQFSGQAREWLGQWFGNSGNFDFARSYAKAIE